MKKKTNWKLLTKYITEEADLKETQQIENWRQSAEENNLLLNNLKEDQKMINDYKEMKKVDVDKAWGNVLGRITAVQQNEDISLKTEERKRIIPLLYKIAASVALVIGLFLVYKTAQSKNEFLTAYSTDNNTIVTLSDGSKVYLNANARIKYPKEFSNKNREIILEGEAFFEVIPDASKPFIVSAGKSQVMVLGTSFLVKEAKKSIRVFVETGKVSFYEKGKENTSVLLLPGELGVLEKNSLVSTRNSDENIISWKTKKIVFTNETFSEMAEVLEKTFNVDIEVKKPENGNCPHAVKFVEGQSLDGVLNVLGTEAFDFKTSQTQNKIIIELKGCK